MRSKQQVPDVEVLCYLKMHKQESDVKDLLQNPKRQMSHDQFDVHQKDDIDHMVTVEIDQDYNHEVYQTKYIGSSRLHFLFDDSI